MPLFRDKLKDVEERTNFVDEASAERIWLNQNLPPPARLNDQLALTNPKE